VSWIRELCRIAIRKHCRRCAGQFGRESLFSAFSDQIPLLILVKNLNNNFAPVPVGLGRAVGISGFVAEFNEIVLVVTISHKVLVLIDRLRLARNLLTTTENLSNNANAGIALYTNHSSSVMRVCRRGRSWVIIPLPIVHESPVNDVLLRLG